MTKASLRHITANDEASSLSGDFIIAHHSPALILRLERERTEGRKREKFYIYLDDTHTQRHRDMHTCMHACRQTDRYGQMDRRTDRHIHTYNTFNTYIDTLLLLLLDFALIYFNLL